MERKDYTPVERELFRDQSTTYSSSWDEDSADSLKDNEIKKEPAQGPWMQRFQLIKDQALPTMQKIPPFLRHDLVPALKKATPTKIQWKAFLLLLFFGIGPFVALFSPYFANSGSGYYTDFNNGGTSPFSSKYISCGESWGEVQNATVSGIEGLFTLDFVFGSMTFAQAKVLDVAWDLIIGKGVQLFAWFISYMVFTNALLRAIERHPSPYRTFLNISLNGPSLTSMLALIKDLARYRSRRTVALFLFLVLCIFYVLALPVILGAMTGYVSTSIPYVTLADAGQQIVSAHDFKDGFIVYDGEKIGIQNGSCISDAEPIYKWASLKSDQRYYCDCKLPNGTLITHEEMYQGYGYYDYTSCVYNYTNNTQTFKSDYTYNDNKVYPCNTTAFNITIDNHNYPVKSLNYTSGWCYNNTGYEYDYLSDNSRCMPDTNNPTYQWGFSTMLSAVFAIVHMLWAVGMYAVWQDAQFNSKLVQEGYKMTQLRAAFTLATAAQGKTGLEAEELMNADTKNLEKELFGEGKNGTKQDAEVTFAMFRKDLPLSRRSTYKGT